MFYIQRLFVFVAVSVCLFNATVEGQDYDLLDSVDVSGTDEVDSTPYAVVFHPTDTLGYASLSGDPGFIPEDTNGSTVIEFDMGSFEIVREFSVDLFPAQMLMSPDGDELYVVCSTAGTLNVIDLENEEVDSIALEDLTMTAVGFPSGIVLSPDGEQLWISSNGGNFDGSDENLLILDRVTLDLEDTIEIDGGLGNFAVTSAGLVVVPVGFPGGDFSAAPEVLIYDSSDGTPWELLETIEIDVPTDDFPAPSDVTIDAVEEFAYVSVFGGSDEVFVIDLESYTASAVVLEETGTVQQSVALTHDGNGLLVSQFFEDRILVIDLEDEEVVDEFDSGALPNDLLLRGGRVWIPNQDDETVSAHEVPGAYLRGDTNGNGLLEVGDAVTLLNGVFLNFGLDCEDTADIDDDAALGLLDAILLLEFLFLGGEPVAYPYPEPGIDFTEDELDC